MSFTVKKDKTMLIDNISLMEPFHEHRLKDVVFNEDFILVPK